MYCLPSKANFLKWEIYGICSHVKFDRPKSDNQKAGLWNTLCVSASVDIAGTGYASTGYQSLEILQRGSVQFESSRKLGNLPHLAESATNNCGNCHCWEKSQQLHIHCIDPELVATNDTHSDHIYSSLLIEQVATITKLHGTISYWRDYSLIGEPWTLLPFTEVAEKFHLRHAIEEALNAGNCGGAEWDPKFMEWMCRA